MMFMPFHILGVWFRGLLAIVIIAGGIYLLKRWYDESNVTVPAPVVEAPVRDNQVRERDETVVEPGRRVIRFDPGMNRETAFLAGGVVLLLWAVAGGWVLRGVSMLIGGPKPAPGGAEDEPRDDRSGEVHRITRPDGSELRVECYGPADAPPIVMTHGWGCTSTEWFYPKKNLAGRFRLILWDEPGLGLSKKPDNNDYDLKNLAADLDAVLAFAGDRPAVLVGHSIGGMITLTFCKVFPEALNRRVAGLVLTNTSYTNPVRTSEGAAFYTAIEKPVIIPLLYLTIALWPLVWAMNWLSYWNGTTHRSTQKESFAGTETRGQLDFIARYQPRARPDVMARGMLGMIHYDATETLPKITVPTLIFVGDKDITTLPEAGQFMSRNIPDARLETLAPARHLGLIERHERFGERVAQFAETCLTTGIRS